MTKKEIRNLVEKVAEAALTLPTGYVAITDYMAVRMYDEVPNKRTHLLITEAGAKYNEIWVERTTDKVYYDFLYEFYRL